MPGEPERSWPTDGGNQGDVRQEAGDDEEDVLHHGNHNSGWHINNSLHNSCACSWYLCHENGSLRKNYTEG